MRIFAILICFLPPIILFSACRRSIDLKILNQLIELSKPFTNEAICITGDRQNFAPDRNHILSIIRKSGYECSMVVFAQPYNDGLTDEDSVLILTKRSFLQMETLYYDFSKRNRILKSWDYPRASDKRVKISDRLYLRTNGFD